MRKLATIQKIIDVKPIPDADKIVAYQINGWWVVDQKDKYSIGDAVIFAEIDSWIPTEIAPFLSKGKEPREYKGVKGEKLRTIRLKKQISQGLILPIASLPAETTERAIGDDVTEALGIQKWEPVIPAQLAGLVKGNFPSQIPKTDQTRVQNLIKEIQEAANSGLRFEVTEKLEGSSCTIYKIDGVFGVCSRNLDLKKDENNAFWKMAIDKDFEGKLDQNCLDQIAIQGELVGPGIQGNIYNLDAVDFYVFDIYDINVGRYLTPNERAIIIGLLNLQSVPIVQYNALCPNNIQDLLENADGKSVIGSKPNREGLVWKEMNGGMTFKAISNTYLLGEK